MSFLPTANALDSELNCYADGAKILTNLTWFPYGAKFAFGWEIDYSS